MRNGEVAGSARREVDFYFDPVCPFAWTAARWLRLVAGEGGLRIGWRFLSLRLANEAIDYATHFPSGYLTGHTAGLRMLRVAAHVRAECGAHAVGDLYAALGPAIFDRSPWRDDAEKERVLGRVPMLHSALREAGLATGFAAAAEDGSWDQVIGRETRHARSLIGMEAGTPILQFDPPHGPAFFGPVISRVPRRAAALELWDHLDALTRFDGLVALKRSLRELPQLPVFGVEPDRAGTVEEWTAGRRLPTAGAVTADRSG